MTHDLQLPIVVRTGWLLGVAIQRSLEPGRHLACLLFFEMVHHY